MRSRSFKIVFASMLAMTSVALSGVSAFAAEWEAVPMNDHADRTIVFTFNKSNGQTDYTSWETKEDNTNVYVKAVPYTLPYGGFTVQSQYKTFLAGISNASKGEYRINDYNEHSIRSDAKDNLNLTNKKVRIKGAYKNMAYTSGDVTIKWSPDTYGSVPSLN